MLRLDPQAPTVTYAAVLDALPIVAFIANSHGVMTYLSRGWEQFTGTVAHEVLDLGYHVVVHPEDLARVVRTWDNARQAEAAYRDEYRLRRGDGSFRWVQSQAEPTRDADGAIVGWLGTLTDIDDLHRAEERLQRSVSDATARAQFAHSADPDPR